MNMEDLEFDFSLRLFGSALSTAEEAIAYARANQGYLRSHNITVAIGWLKAARTQVQTMAAIAAVQEARKALSKK